MKEQRITIEIDSQGQITADADGFSGDACIQDLDRLLEDLAPGSVSVDRKPDREGRRVVKRTQTLGKKP